jgi:hypothetical protein
MSIDPTKKPKFRANVRKDLFRIPVTITKEMEHWLHKLSSEMKSSGGYKLPKSYIVRSLISAAMKLDMDVSGVKEEKDLEERFMKAIERYK